MGNRIDRYSYYSYLCFLFSIRHSPLLSTITIRYYYSLFVIPYLPMLIIKSVIQPIAAIDRLLPVLQDIEFFSPYEHQYCGKKANTLASLAGIWCAKTALSQAIVNVVQFPACTFSDFEVCHAANGRPWIGFNDHLAQWCREQELTVDLSITHTGDFAAASVLLYAQTKRYLPQ